MRCKSFMLIVITLIVGGCAQMNDSHPIVGQSICYKAPYVLGRLDSNAEKPMYFSPEGALCAMA